MNTLPKDVEQEILTALNLFAMEMSNDGYGHKIHQLFTNRLMGVFKISQAHAIATAVEAERERIVEAIKKFENSPSPPKDEKSLFSYCRGWKDCVKNIVSKLVLQRPKGEGKV